MRSAEPRDEYRERENAATGMDGDVVQDWQSEALTLAGALRTA